MTGRQRMKQALFALIILAGSVSPAYAQRFVNAQVSAGGVAFVDGHIAGHALGGWYADAMKSLVPGTAVVAELSGFYGAEREPLGAERWFAFLGGVRQRIVQRPGANVFVQLVGGYGRYSQRFSGNGGFTNVVALDVIQPGVGVDIPTNDQWAIRVRTDGRIALTSDGDGATGGWSFAMGVNRYWGRR